MYYLLQKKVPIIKTLSLLLAYFVFSTFVKAVPTITFTNTNHLVTHGATAKQIAFTGLVGAIQSISTTSPSSYSVITNLRRNGSNIEFNTKGTSRHRAYISYYFRRCGYNNSAIIYPSYANKRP